MIPKKPLNQLTVTDMHGMNDAELDQVYKAIAKMAASEEEVLRNKIQTYQTQMPNLQAGNLDDVNKIIWPFIFTSQIGDDNVNASIPPNTTESGFISITQEASFVATKMYKIVFEKN